jgi:hypothetical protein
MSSASRLALSARVCNSRFSKRPGCTAGGMVSSPVIVRDFALVGVASANC